MEALAIIFAFAGIVVGSVLTYFFTRSHYERKRQDDLADREFNRRVEMKDKRIAEAQAYIDAYYDATQKLAKFEFGLIKFGKEIPNSPREDFAKIPKLTEFTSKRTTSMLVFGDLELLELNRELIIMFNTEYINAIELFEKTLHAKPVDKGAAKVRVDGFYKNITLLFVKVQARLEEVSE